MSDNKKYYYLKFKENFFEQDHIKVIETMDNGFIYIVILLKLYLKSLKYDGQLKINESIPWHKDKVDMLAKVIGHDSDHVMKAMNIAHSLKLIEIIDTGEIFMADIQNFIGHSSTEADRKKLYRDRIKNKSITSKDLTKGGQVADKCPDKRPPELEIELKKELELKKNFQKPTIEEIQEYCNQRNNNVNAESFYHYYESKGWMIGKNKMKSWKSAVITWEKRERKDSGKVDLSGYDNY